MKRWLTERLWTRLAALSLLASVAPILGAGILMTHAWQKAAREEAVDRLESLAETADSIVLATLDRARGKLHTVSRLLVERLGDLGNETYRDSNIAYKESVIDSLDRIVDPPDLYLELLYYAADSTDPEKIGETFSNGANYVGSAQQGAYREIQTRDPGALSRSNRMIEENIESPVVQEPMLNQNAFVEKFVEFESGIPTHVVSVPVTDTAGTTLGVLVARVDLRSLEKDLSIFLGEESLRLEVIDTRDQVLTKVGSADEPALTIERTLESPPWKILAKQSLTALEEPLVAIRRQTAIWSMLAALFATVLSIGFSRWIVRPVEVLTRAARSMEHGSLNARSGIKRHDEIGQLAVAFDQMAAGLQRLDEAKSEFVSNVSHELRTPLTSIRLSIANLLDGVVGDLDNRQTQTLGRLRKDVDRLIRLVSDLLEIARLEAGAIVPKKQRFSLEPLARECVASLGPLAHERGLTLVLKGEGMVDADRTMVQRILTNLVDNAIKYTPQGGHVHVLLCQGGFDVNDTGPGFDSQELVKKFAQGKSRGIKHAGAGLGLAIVSKLIEVHRGNLIFGPDSGEGTRAKVRFDEEEEKPS